MYRLSSVKSENDPRRNRFQKPLLCISEIRDFMLPSLAAIKLSLLSDELGSERSPSRVMANNGRRYFTFDASGVVRAVELSTLASTPVFSSKTSLFHRVSNLYVCMTIYVNT